MENILKLLSLLVGSVLVVAFMQLVTETKFAQLQEARAAMPADVITAKEREEQLKCLALNIYREAGNEPFEGKVGVAQVTLNRVLSDNFPDTVCNVVYQKTVGTRIVCQFSWYCDRTHRNRPIDEKTYIESYNVAKKVLLEGFALDNMKDAIYYHADYVNPKWKMERIAKIGVHIFYKEKKA